MEKFEITDKNISNGLRIGKYLAPLIVRCKVDNTDLMVFTVIMRIYMEESFKKFGNDVKEFNEMYAYCESETRKIIEFLGRDID